MNLVEKQQVFSVLLAKLIFEIYGMGMKCTIGEVWRSPAEAKRLGFENSLHPLRLAVDINLFIDGKYTKRSEDYEELGRIWKGYSTELFTCRWGGDFIDEDGEPLPDGNHFSIEHNGVK